MNVLSQSRIAVLRAQGNCPACGAPVSVHAATGSQFSVLFKCGAIIDVKDNQPLTVLKACPSPSAVAVAQLNRQADAMARDLIDPDCEGRDDPEERTAGAA